MLSEMDNEITLDQIGIYISFIMGGHWFASYDGTAPKEIGDCMMTQLVAVHLGFTNL